VSFYHIRGHEKLIHILTRVIKTGRLSHAYLFSGLEGIGKRLIAIAFSKVLLCSSGDSESCGECSACIQVDGGNHPDLLMVQPYKGTISIDSIRSIKRELSRKSFAGGYKVCLIDEAEKMNFQAENALLKTLEEPTPDTVIILITGQPYRLLPTVLSRCQHFKFQPLSISSAAALIMERGNIDRQTASLLASLTGGSPGKALELNAEYVKQLRDTWIEHSLSSSRGELQDIFKLAENFCRDKDTIHLKLNLLRLWYRDIILCKIYGNSDNLLNNDKADEIASLSSFWSLDKLLRALFWIEECNQILDRNVNPQLSMEALFLKLHSESDFSPHHSGSVFPLSAS